MGTRNLTVVVKDSTPKVAQYGQWDGYPSGVGADILKFISDPTNVEALRVVVDKVHFAAEGEYEAIISETEPALAAKQWITMEEADRLNKLMPTFNRDLGGKILEHLVSSDDPRSLILKDSFAFGEDSLFCEWAYVLDLDADTLEVYTGFQTSPHTEGRWASYVPDAAHSGNGGPYYGIRLVKTYSLADLPDEATFVAEVEALTTDPEDAEV